MHTHRSFQKDLSSSIVLIAPRMRAKRTSTPPSPRPQKALQKSRERLEKSGEPARAYREREVVDVCRRADIVVVREMGVGRVQAVVRVLSSSSHTALSDARGVSDLRLARWA